MPILNQIAVVSTAASVSLGELLQVSAALQKQVMRDFAPLWDVVATVDAFARLEEVPVGYWPLMVVDQVVTGELGVHGQRDRQPMALVQAGPNWSLTASHEALEMLADPFSNRLQAGNSPAGDGQRVEYLVEVCDPCQDPAFSYEVNGVLVSDFYTPQYFDAEGSAGARYDFLGAIRQPRQVLEGGYLSWRHPETNHLHRVDCITGQLWLSDLGDVPTTVVSLRSYMDSNPRVLSRKKLPVRRPRSRRPKVRSSHQNASAAKARRLMAQIASLRAAKP